MLRLTQSTETLEQTWDLKAVAFVIYKRAVAYRQGGVLPQRDHTNP